MGRVSLTSVILGLEAAALAGWAAGSAAPAAVALAAVGLAFTLSTYLNPQSNRVRGELFNWVGRLHRCMLAYNLSPADCLAACAALPAAVRLSWVVLARAGVANVGILSLVLQPTSVLLAAQQLAMALLLAKRTPAICAVAGDGHLPLPAFARSELQRWLPYAGRLLVPPADVPDAALACYSSVLSLIFAVVLVLPLTLAWVRRSRQPRAPGPGPNRPGGRLGRPPPPGDPGAVTAAQAGNRPEGHHDAAAIAPWEPHPGRVFTMVYGAAMVAVLCDLYYNIS